MKRILTRMSSNKFFWLAGTVVLAIVMFVLHRKVPFMMDDLWYSTNLATGEPLKNFADVVESQIWHFLNWGGRSMTHGVLQLTLMSGEWMADVFNLVMTLLLSYMICLIAGQRKPLWIFMAFSMLVSLNPNVKMSMFWQAGAVNYVYSSVWILLFLWPYMRKQEKTDASALPLVWLWILPIGLMAGWSNENMGPACFLIAVAATVYFVKKEKKLEVWMLSGTVVSLAGSILMIVAPGNFVRTAAIEKKGLVATISERLFSMLQAGVDFLFPSVTLVIITLLIYIVCLKGKLEPVQWAFLALTALSYGAMILSPHYPDRATFGTMVACIVLLISVWKNILEKRSEWIKYVSVAGLGSGIYALYLFWDVMRTLG